MAQKTTLKEIATTLGLDISTVSRALRGDKRVRPETSKLIEETANRLDYVPNLAARNLVAGKTKTILFILSSLDNLNESYPCQKSFEFLHELGYTMFCALGRQDQEYAKQLLTKLQQGIADGALYIPNGNEDCSILEPTLQKGLPVVLIDRDIPNSSVPLVTTDNSQASFDLVMWAYQKGYREFIEIFDDSDNSVTTERRLGAHKAFNQLGINFSTRTKLKLAPDLPVCLIGTNQSSVYSTAIENQKIFIGRDICFCVYDKWVGSTYPAKDVRVAVQDFSGIAEKAVEIITGMLAKSKKKHQKVYSIPVLEYRTINNDFSAETNA